MISKLWYLQQLNLFKDLGREALKELDQLVLEKECPINTEIDISKTDILYILKKGKVTIYNITPKGKKVIINTLEPGSLFGNLQDDLGEDIFATATEDSLVCSINKEQFFDFASNYSSFSRKLISLMFTNLSETEYKISILGADNAMAGFVKLLKMLAKKYGVLKGKKIKINRKFTHEQLADMMNITRQTATEIINKMEKQRLIKREDKHILVGKEVLES